jgi:hypothetical protein
VIDKNLKGTHHRLLYYRNHYIEDEAVLRMVGDNEQTYMKKENERIYVPEEEVRRFSLDKHGQPIPYVDGHVTIISNYVYDYWGHFLSDSGVALYGHLKRYCYGDRDYCWPDLKLIGQKMNRSRNTLKKILGTLEKYGFVFMFYVQNADKNNMEESPLFKVRKKVPFLPQELYEQLPTELKLDHDRYMQQIVETFNQNLTLDTKLDYNEIYEDVLQKGKVVRKQKSTLELEKELQIKRKIYEKEASEQDRNIWAAVLKNLEHKLSKPSFDTWFRGTFCIKRNHTYVICTPNTFVKEWVQSRYNDLVYRTLRQHDPNFVELKYEALDGR